MITSFAHYFSNVMPGASTLAARCRHVLRQRHMAAISGAPYAASYARRDTGRALWLTTFIGMLGLVGALAGSSRGAAVFLGVWAIMACLRAGDCRRLVFRTPALWLVPGMAMASVLWSQDAAASLRAATELGLTVAIASLTAGLVPPRAFLTAVLFSMVLGALDCLINGQIGMDGLSGTVVFMGVFGSKNTLAMFMSFMAIFAAAVMADGKQPWQLRGLAVAAFGVSIPLLIRGHSAGAAVTTIISFTIMGLTMVFARMQPRERMLTLICAAGIGVPLLLAICMAALNGTLYDTWAAFLHGVLGKDPTLTGRTVLWHIAMGQIHLRPVLGMGYSAFWIQGNLLPEGIWRAFQIDNRMGFSFHDTYMEVAVELGWVGVAALVLTFLRALTGAVRMALVQKSWPAACFVTCMFCLLGRSIGEVDTPYPFAFTTYILFVIAAYGADFARHRVR